MKKKKWVFRRGDLYMANLNPVKGSEQGGRRPVLVIQSNEENYRCPTLIIAPVTVKYKKDCAGAHYYLGIPKGLSKPSIVDLEQIRTIDKSRVERYLGKIPAEQMSGIDEIIGSSLGLVL